MLQKFRNNLKGAGAAILVAIIVVPFAFFGVNTLFTSGRAVNEVANVNGDPITELELQQAVQLRKQQLLKQYPDMDPSQLEDDFLGGFVLDNLIAQKVVVQRAGEDGMAVPMDYVFSLLVDVPAYQEEGKFSNDRYEYLIRQMGYTAKTHMQAVGNEVLIESFIRGVAETGFTTNRELDQLIALIEQRRDFFYLTIPAKPVVEKTEVSDEEISSYYEANKANFVTDEKVKVEYISLASADLMDQVTPDDAAIEAAFESRLTEAKTVASRKVAHIMLEKETVKEHPERLQEIENKISHGEDFATLAKEYSEDLGSAEQGGLLGLVAKGDLPEPLEKALDAMKAGDVSQPVESDAGFHILKLMSDQGAELPTLDELKPEIVRELKVGMAKELLVQRAEELKELAYNATDLDSVAEQLGLKVRQSSYFGRQGGEEAPMNNPAVVKAAFSEDVLVDRYTSDVIEISDDQVVVLRVTDYKPEAVSPFDEVKTQVVKLLREQKAKEAIMQTAATLKGKLESGQSLKELAVEQKYDWQVGLDVKHTSTNVDEQVRDFAFNLAAEQDKNVVDGFFNSAGDYVLVQQTKVAFGDKSLMPKKQQVLLAQRLGITEGLREAGVYQQNLVDTAKVKRKK